MPEELALDPSTVGAAVRALLHKETSRIDDPHFIPEDRAGWHPVRTPSPDAAGAPYYEPESWRWFELVDVGYIDEMVLIVFHWTDPSTPELRYSILAHADGLHDPEAVAFAIRGQLRRLLEAGWRDRVEKRWLSQTQVLIWRPRHEPTDIPALNESRKRSDQRLAQTREQAWHAPRNDC